jgi:hypothetical protein
VLKKRVAWIQEYEKNKGREKREIVDDDPLDFHVRSNIIPKKEYVWECTSKTLEIWEGRTKAVSEADMDVGEDVGNLVEEIEGLEFTAEAETNVMATGKRKREGRGIDEPV